MPAQPPQTGQLQAGTIVGNYRIESTLGAGSQGTVYLAEDVLLGRKAALKMFSSRIEAAARNALLAEARLIARIDHPNVVQVYHVGLDQASSYMAIEYVSGGDLTRHLAQCGKLAPARALEIAYKTLRALDHAHGLGIVHRDIKPQNILGTAEGELKLADFGLAGVRVTGASRQFAVGTPYYMAPEVWNGNAADERSDVYSLGAVLYYMVCGRPPFLGDTPQQLRQAVHDTAPVFDPGLPLPLIEGIGSLMAKRPEQRPSNARQAARLLKDAREKIVRGERKGSSGAYSVAFQPSAESVAYSVQPFGEAQDRLAQALVSRAIFVAVHGLSAAICRRLLEGICNNQPQFFLAARLEVNNRSASSVRDLALRLTAESGGEPSSKYQSLNKLLTSGGESDSRGIIELHVASDVEPAVESQLVELIAKARNRRVTFICVSERAVGRRLTDQLRRRGAETQVEVIDVPAPTLDQALAHVRVWARMAPGDPLVWTKGALVLAAHVVSGRPEEAYHLVNNAMTIASSARLPLVTTWCVEGAQEHLELLQRPEDVQPEWRSVPAKWPTEACIKLVAELLQQVTPEGPESTRA